MSKFDLSPIIAMAMLAYETMSEAAREAKRQDKNRLATSHLKSLEGMAETLAETYRQNGDMLHHEIYTRHRLDHRANWQRIEMGRCRDL